MSMMDTRENQMRLPALRAAGPTLDPSLLPARDEQLRELQSLSEQRFPGAECAALRAEIARSLATPQCGEYHQEGGFMNAHLHLMLKALDRTAQGVFPDDVPMRARAIMERCARQRREDLERYVLLHDLKKPDCLTLTYAAGKDEEISWQDWQAMLSKDELGNAAREGDEAALRAFCSREGIASISYYQHSAERYHGPEAARRLAEGPEKVSDDIISAVKLHEIAYLFSKISIPTYHRYFGVLDEPARALVLTGSYIDSCATIQAGGAPDLSNFVSLARSEEATAALIEALSILAGEERRSEVEQALIALHCEGKEGKLQSLVHAAAGDTLVPGVLLARVHGLRTTMEPLELLRAGRIASDLAAAAKLASYNIETLAGDPDLQNALPDPAEQAELLRLAAQDPRGIGRRFGRSMKVLKPILERNKE